MKALECIQLFTTFNFLHQVAQSRATDPFLPACSTYSNSLNFPNTDKHSCCEEMKPH